MYFFVGKKGIHMRKYILFIVLMAGAAACEVVDVGDRPQRGDVWVRPGVDMDSLAAGSTVAYVTAMEYLDSYDWMSDKENGSVKCSLAVYADGIPVMKVPVGEEYEISSDPESHRMVKGHLYTDYVSEDETVIKRDGRVLFRYAGREMLCGLVESEGDVYTLGHSLDGDGFSYRKNGEVLMARARGTSFGSLRTVGGRNFFAFRESVSGGTYERYYGVMDGEITQVAIRQDIMKVWDVAYYNGGICYLASLVGIPFPVLFVDDIMQTLSLPKEAMLVSCSLLCDDKALYAEGLMNVVRQGTASCIWTPDGEICFRSANKAFSSFCMKDGGIHSVLNPSPPYDEGEIFRSGESFQMPPRYFSIGSRTTAVINGILHVGLSSQKGSPPLLWKDGKVMPLQINGFITTVSTK